MRYIFIFIFFYSFQAYAINHLESCKLLKQNSNKFYKWGSKEKVTSQEVIVAVIDTGIDIHHESLKQSLWQNPGEVGTDTNGRDKRSNGIDDDHNGFIDDVNGWNFVNNNSQLQDQNGHGTHIAGIIAGKNSFCGEAFGVAPMAKIMVLKYYHPLQNGQITLEKSIAAMRYAMQMGAKIINYSGGGISPDEKEEKVLEQAKAKGILVVAAAGNEKSLADSEPYYPASYNLNNILSVAAVDEKFQLADFSNFGLINVDIAGPGVKIWSSLPGNSYGLLSGTSQSTAFLSGLSALILSQNPGIVDPQEVILRIYMSRQKVSSLIGKTKFSGVANVGRSLQVQAEGHSLNGGYTHSFGLMKNWFVPSGKNSILFFK
ncbi:MAG: S8 family serine peptidase [Bdellovibrionaceae bacterium]|nr:S8 family serine peptidase [Pseudobdellovibrionaceae bacterium]